MKSAPALRLIVVALAATGAFALVGCATTPKAETQTVAEADAIRTYEVFGMNCPGCHGGLEKLVKAIPGVTDAEASWQDKRLTLTTDKNADVSDKAVREAIGRANFTAGERLK